MTKAAAAPNKGNDKEVDYVAKQANLTSQIESERLAAKKWWEEFGLCFIEGSKLEDFSYENRIEALKQKLQDEKFQHAKSHTTSSEYGCRPPFKECATKKC